jgi:hypothetical protein
MKAHNFTISLAAAVMIFTGAALNASTTITSNTTYDTYINSGMYCGQSFLFTGSNYILDSITLYYDGSPASGSGYIYLFDSAYSGRPSALTSSSYLTMGTWDSSTSSWVFSDDYVLTAGTTYYFYMGSSFAVSYSSTNAYSSGIFYSALLANRSFSSDAYYDLAFSVTGTAVPEPATYAGLLGLIALGAVGGRKLTARRS